MPTARPTTPGSTWRDIRRTTTFRLTALLGLVFGIGLTALLGLVYLLIARELTARSDRILHLGAARLLAVPAAQLPARIRFETAHHSNGIDYFALFGTSGERIAGNIDRPLPAVIPAARVAPLGEPLRVLSVRTAWGEMIVVGRDTGQVRALQATLVEILFGSGVVVAMVVVSAGVLLSLAPLRRVRALQAASRAIAHGDLGIRMPIAGRHDELDLFAGTVNVMVDEVERVIGQVKSVTDAVAHDLRTPLTRVRVQLSQIGATGESMLATRALANLDIVLDRFAALLRISEMGTRDRRAGFGPTDLGPLIARAAELYEPLAASRGQTLTAAAEPSFVVHADGKLLFEAVSNLLDNAIKFTPAGGTVSLRLRPRATGCCIEVADDGPGIAATERDAVLARFYRSPATAAQVEGSGLGLSVVAAIAELHHFDLELDDAAPGLIVRLCCVA